MQLSKRHGTTVEPYVDQLGSAVESHPVPHEIYPVNKRLVQIELHQTFGKCVSEPVLFTVDIDKAFFQFLNRPDSKNLARIRTIPDFEILRNPYWQRCSPETLTRQRPVLVLFEPVAKPACPDFRRTPVNMTVKLHHPVGNTCRPDIPGLPRIVNHRYIITPGKRIGMGNGFLSEKLSFLFQPPNNQRIDILEKQSLIFGNISRKTTVARHRLQHRKIICF